MKQFERNIALIGREAQEILLKSKVLIFGVGGVGGYVCEALARSGVGQVDVVDADAVDVTNINRQIIADYSTIGKNKVDLIKARMKSINPNIVCKEMNIFFSQETIDDIDFEGYDYVVDAIDTVKSKLLIIEKTKSVGIPIISCMGTGNKLDCSRFKIDDISKTSVCPLARAVRRELSKKGITDVTVLYSDEKPIKVDIQAPASISFIPSIAGLTIAGYVVKDLINQTSNTK